MTTFSPAVSNLIDSALKRTESHGRRVAVFDFDNTLIFNDIGELFSYYLIDEVLYRYDLDAFWDLIEAEDGRDEIRALAVQAMAMDADERAASPIFRKYRAEMTALYSRKLERDGKRSCYAWAVTLHVGLTELEMSAMSEQAIRRELSREIQRETVHTSRGEAISFTRGIRMLEPMRELIARLHSEEVEVWICSASNYWTVAQFAPRFGVNPERVIGNRVQTTDRRLSSDLIAPAMFMEGKAEAIMRDVGMPPTFVFGDSETDLHMLREATGLAVVIDTGSAADLVTEANVKGWAVQPQADLLGDAG